MLGLPRGGSKAGIASDPADATTKVPRLRAFGVAIRSLMANRDVAVGPDMGVTVEDVREIYAGAGVEQIRSGLFEQVRDNDAVGYHLTGHGVIAAAMGACEVAKLPFRGSRIAIEGFGQVGVGCARRAGREGAKIVAISTSLGGLYDPAGLDLERLMSLRRSVGDRCVIEYGRGERIASDQLYFLPVDIMIPGARPWVIDERNCDRVQAKLVCSGGNITVTDGAQEALWRRGVVTVPDFVANAGAAISSLVDFLGGTPEQALAAVDRLVSNSTRTVMTKAQATGEVPYRTAVGIARERVVAARGKPRKTFAQSMTEIRGLLGLG
jgi:glutamate dehydrogenase/leucine dehydrogenase